MNSGKLLGQVTGALCFLSLLLNVSTAVAACPTSLSGKFAGSFLYTTYNGTNAQETYAGDIVVTLGGGKFSSNERGKRYSNGALYSVDRAGVFSYSVATCRGQATSQTGTVYSVVILNSGNNITLTYYTGGAFNVLGSFILTKI